MSDQAALQFALFGASEWLRTQAADVGLLVLGLIPLTAALWVGARRRDSLTKLAQPRHLHRLVPDLGPRGTEGVELLAWISRRSWTRGLLGGAAVLLMGAAFLGPVRGHALVPVSKREIDVAVVLDTSRSMLAEDVVPNRLERAKREISGLFDSMRGERVAHDDTAGRIKRTCIVCYRQAPSRISAILRGSPDKLFGQRDIRFCLVKCQVGYSRELGPRIASAGITEVDDLNALYSGSAKVKIQVSGGRSSIGIGRTAPAIDYGIVGFRYTTCSSPEC